jgi:CheY-like chemotaxis protein
MSVNLTGRSIVVVALDREVLFDVTGAIESTGARWQAFSGPVDARQLRGFDVIVCGSATVPELWNAGVPLLAVGQANVQPPSDFVVMPVRADEVAVRLDRILTATPPQRRPAVTTPVVLVADDDPTTTAIVRAVVTQNAMQCEIARDGQQAIDAARALVPTAVVLDVNMPFRDGFEVLSVLRSDPATESIPVLMLTSVQQEVDVVKGFRLGADDYVIKPFNPMELLARIKRLVRKA